MLPELTFGIQGPNGTPYDRIVPISAGEMMEFYDDETRAGRDLRLNICIEQRKAEIRLDLSYQDNDMLFQELPLALKDSRMRKPRSFLDCFRSYYNEVEGISAVIAMHGQTVNEGFLAALSRNAPARGTHNPALVAYDLSNIVRECGSVHWPYVPPGKKGEWWPEYGHAKYNMTLVDSNDKQQIFGLKYPHSFVHVGMDSLGSSKPACELLDDLMLISGRIAPDRVRCMQTDWYDYVVTLNNHLFRWNRGQLEVMTEDYLPR